jgi:hypothetical protein
VFKFIIYWGQTGKGSMLGFGDRRDNIQWNVCVSDQEE